jgi:hypothetical protein
MGRRRWKALSRAAALGLVLTSLACAAKPAAPPKRDLDSYIVLDRSYAPSRIGSEPQPTKA